VSDSPSPDLLEAPPEQQEGEADAFPALPEGRASRLPILLLVAGSLFVGGGIALAVFRGAPGTADLTDRLLRAGLGPPTLLLFGAGLLAVALFAYDGRRAERRLWEAIEAAAARPLPAPSEPFPPQAPPELAERMDALARSVDAVRHALAQIDTISRKVTDGVEATYRSSESVKEQLGRFRSDAGLASAEDFATLRAGLEEAFQSIRTGIEGLARGKKGSSGVSEEVVAGLSEQVAGIAASLAPLGRKVEEILSLKAGVEAVRRAAAEERDVSRAVAGEMERLVTLVAQQMGAIAESVAAIAHASGETRELRAGIERILAALRERPAPAPPPPPPPPAPAFNRDFVPSWETRRADPGFPAQAPSPLDPAKAAASAAASTGGQGILDAIQRLKALRKPPPG
jgi:hypothetical protein